MMFAWSGHNLIRLPVVGRFLRFRHARLVMQVPLFLIASLIIFDGLAGPQLAPKNLATVGVWLHYRGLVVLALLLAGNLFCMACPFMLPRRVGRWIRERFAGGGIPVPRWLRGKWVATFLILAFFYSYEVFDLWASPWLTAWIAVGYFLIAFAADTVFAGAAFCKHICPLGQFNFFGSLVSPFEVRTRDLRVCSNCRTKDCITAGTGKRRETGAFDLRGCELWLFQERKRGNMDCTFCLDCVHACPYDNVGIISRPPLAELWDDGFRSGIGRLSQRLDLAAMIAVLVFGGFVNAFGMIQPVYGLQAWLATWLGVTSPIPGLSLIFLFGLVLLPVASILAAGWLGARLSSLAVGSQKPVVSRVDALRQQPSHSPVSSVSAMATAKRYVYSLVPLGFGMWLAHYSFHFLTGALTIVPVIQSFLVDVGVPVGEVQWGWGPLVPGAWLFPIEALFLYLGGLGSLIVAFQIARRQHPGGDRPSRTAVLGAMLPWALLVFGMLGAGLWILVQPMEMRGTMMMLTMQQP